MYIEQVNSLLIIGSSKHKTMDLNSITQAIKKLDRDRDLITPEKGSHTNIEGSTGESKFSKIQEVVLSRT
jgi:hypothetical protein